MSVASKIPNEIADHSLDEVKPLEDFFPDATLILLAAWDFSRSPDQESEIDGTAFRSVVCPRP